MAAIDHLLVFRTPQDVDHMCAAVAFAALRKPRDTGQQLLRFQRPVFGDFGFQAVVASTAPPFEHFTKVAQLNRTAAFIGFGVVDNLAQLLTREALLLLKRLAGVRERKSTRLNSSN